MKKGFKFLTLLAMTISIAACSCKKEEVKKESVLNNSAAVIKGSKTPTRLSTQDIYSYIRENESEQVNKLFLTYLMGTVLDFHNKPENKTIYDLKIKEHFKTNYLNADDYKVNGVFDEDILATKLEADLYVIDRVNTPTSGPTAELGLSYDYSDYIDRAIKYDLYLEMLKEDYIIKVKPNYLNNSRTRIISVYESDDLEDIEQIVSDLFEGKYTSLKDVSDLKKDEEKEEIGRQFCVNLGLEDGDYYDGECSPSTSSSTYDSALYKFTVCENGVRCTPSEGLAYQIKLIEDTEYVKEQVVNKDTTDILYEQALNQLLRSDVEDYLYDVIDGQDKFLVNGLYNNDEDFANRDIILSSGPNNKNYLVTVRVVDSNTTNVEDREKALALILSKVSDATVLMHYLEDLDVEVEDPALKEYYNSLIGK